jgi:hypothetical protein
MRCAGRTTHVEFENSGHHDDRLRSVSILEHREFHSFGAIKEQATTKALLILCDPIAAAVSADMKQPQWRRWALRKKLILTHWCFPDSRD